MTSSRDRKDKPLRRFLRRLGPAWTQTPWRRLAQALCLVLFLVLFFYWSWPYRSDTDSVSVGSSAPVEVFLTLDPLVAISTALAARTLVWSLTAAAVALAIGVVLPRWFCGYVCPLGTLIDLWDWGMGRRVKRFRLTEKGWWVNLRFYFLAGILAAAALGVLLSGFVAALPVVTRGML